MHPNIFVGNNIDFLKSLPDNSIDAVVTDPPYGLGKEPDPLEVIKAWIADEEFHASGGGFMGKEWDSFVPNPSVWKECFRVLKPGGHLLSFGGTRTYDWIVLGVRLAGFEIRDMLGFLHGQGMPKGLNIRKGIDNALRLERPLKKDRTQNIESLEKFNYENLSNEQASKWEGWNTSMKPAIEPIVMARKPLDGTVVENVLRYGVGGINIDACRVPLTGEHKDRSHEKSSEKTYSDQGATNFNCKPGPRGGSSKGRYPSNIIHDGSEVVIRAFPYTENGLMVAKTQRLGDKTRNIFGTWGGNDVQNDTYGDKGSATRYYNVAPFDPQVDTPFYYCSKAAPKERHVGDANNNHPTVKPLALMRWLVRLVTPPNGTVLDPYLGSGTTAMACVYEGFGWKGCEINPDYAEIASKRIQSAEEENYNPFGV